MNKLILLLQCPDAKGIVHDVTGFILRNGGNILELEQFVDQQNNGFFMRVVWDADGFGVSYEDFDDAFSGIAIDLNITYELFQTEKQDRLALFCSKSLHCLTEVLLQQYLGNLPVKIALIVSNSLEAADVALKFAIPFEYTPMNSDNSNKGQVEEKQLGLLDDYRIDVIGLARYMRILSKGFVAHHPNSIINIHHSFLPAFIGRNPYTQAYERGVKIIGATSHFVTADLDQGPIIAQDIKHVHHGYSAELLQKTGQEIEKKVFVTALKKYLERKIIIYGNRTVVFE